VSGVPRSQRLFAHHSTAAGYGTGWTCPDGFVTLAKTCYIHNAATAAAIVQLVVTTYTGTAVYMLLHETIEADADTKWEGWIALNPGDQINVFTDQIGPTFWLSGAVLAGPPQFPNVPSLLPAVEPHG
jgi:hypothetical protein